MKVNNRLLAALSGAALLLSLAACGGDGSGKKRDDWAKGVCDQSAAQIAKINAANTAISKVDSGGKPQAVKSADSAAFQTISGAYGSLSSIFDKAGAPPGDEGLKFQQSAVSFFKNLSTQYAGLKKQVDGLDTSSQGKFADGLKSVSDSLTKVTAEAATPPATLRGGDTGKALAKQPGCQQVSGSPSPTAS